MTELKRTYTVDQLEAIGVPWENVVVRDEEDEHRWYVLWRIVFRDPADDTTWSVLRAEDKTEMGEIPWHYAYGDDRDAAIECLRVEAREVTVTQWVTVANDTAGSTT